MADFLITSPVATAAPQIIPGDMNRKRLTETVSRRDAAAEPPRMADICSCNICISYIRVGRFTACLSKVPPVYVGCKQWFLGIYTGAEAFHICGAAVTIAVFPGRDSGASFG